ncbi:Pentacotripeptide-repeat region of PRORP domain-containing protein [Plasmodiophora brassicae]|uniref:Pentatricopeptide repeat-containing protein-mitochondrial domain-containing protein n=1 Tax=Plasmodiophora brassicae TaxID=37360 RepID=A0A0G4IN66_PLABS|nr:hypothetical protein PBRA_005357 [Plasmodiophora brassicae]
MTNRRRDRVSIGEDPPPAPRLVQEFMRSPTVPLAVCILNQETDTDRAWTVFQRMLDSGASLEIPFFQSMMTFCKRFLAHKAADVLHAAVSHDVPVCDGLFGTFLSACLSTRPIMHEVALEQYAKYGPRTHNVMYGLVHVCRQAQRPDLAVFLVSDAAKHNVEFTVKLFTVFAACCAEARTPEGADAAENLLELCGRKHFSPGERQAAFANIVTAVLSQDRIDSALNVLSLMGSIGMTPSWQIYTNVVSALAKDGRITDAMHMFDAVAQRDLCLGLPGFATLVVACGRQAKLGSIEKLRRFAIDKNIILDPLVISAFVSAYGQCGRLRSVVDLEKRIAEGGLAENDDVICCALVSAYDRCDDIQSAERVFLARRVVSPPPDVPTFNAMIAAYSRRGMLSKAIETFDFVRDAGLTLSVEICTNVLSVLSKDGRAKDAMSLFHFMAQEQFEVAVPVFGCLVAACGRSSDIAAVHDLYDYASDKGFLSSDVVVCTFISAYDHCGDIGAAEQTFRRRCETSAPDAPTFSAMMAAFSHHGMFVDAARVFDALQATGPPLSLETCTIALHALAKADRVSQAMSLIQTMAAQSIPVDAPVLTTVVAACGRCNDLSSLQTLFQYAQANALLADDNVATNAFISAYKRCGHVVTPDEIRLGADLNPLR